MKLPPAYKKRLLIIASLSTLWVSHHLLVPQNVAAQANCSLTTKPKPPETTITEDIAIVVEGTCSVRGGATDAYLRLWLNADFPGHGGTPGATPLPPTPLSVPLGNPNFEFEIGSPNSLGLSPGTYFITARCSETLATHPGFEDKCDKKTSFSVTTPGGGVPSEFCPGGFANTAIGKIECTPRGLAGAFLGLALGVAGGIALLLVIVGGYRVMASQGDPEALAEGKDMITRAIAGLLFIVFSAAILRIIGIQLLGLPGG